MEVGFVCFNALFLADFPRSESGFRRRITGELRQRCFGAPPQLCPLVEGRWLEDAGVLSKRISFKQRRERERKKKLAMMVLFRRLFGSKPPLSLCLSAFGDLSRPAAWKLCFFQNGYTYERGLGGQGREIGDEEKRAR